MSNKAIKNDLIEDPQGTLSERVFGQILEAIYSGSLPPGSIINEVALAQEFGVSRGPVREAVRRLQGIQLVTCEPYVKSRVVMLSAQTALELFQMRMALEGVACGLAAQRMSEKEVDQLIDELEQDRQQRSVTSTGEGALMRVFDFHERIVRACGNQRIINALCGDLYHLLRIYRRHSGTVLERKHDAYSEHWQILRAIKMRDALLAESLMRSHIERAAQHLSEHLDNLEEVPSIGVRMSIL
ncbi:MAG TPA: GntR family transcriptional regulator [Eoetvoesiella sp.]